MSAASISQRATAIQHLTSLKAASDFFDAYVRRSSDPDALDFTFGNPHEMPPAAYVETLQAAIIPQAKDWFAYKQYVPAAQEAAAAALRRLLGLPFAAEDILLTTGGFAAIAVAVKAVGDPGDEVIYNLPPWFVYEGIVVEAGLVPVRVRIDLTTFDLDLDAIAAAITPRTRLVIVNSPNNPTGRVYPPATLTRLAALLEEASRRHGRRIYLISDEPYNRIVFDGIRFHSPLEFYPYSFLAYSYGKTHLAPGQRIGYLALPPTMPEREPMRQTLKTLQIVTGWVFPNAVLQYALPRLEEFSIDIARLQRKRDRMVTALRDLGYDVVQPEGTFYLFVRSPIADDAAFTDTLAAHGVLVLPGYLFETPGFFRICLTATEETIEASLPGFAAAIAQYKTSVSPEPVAGSRTA